MERIPDLDELSIVEEAGATAPLGKPRPRFRAGLATAAAVLGLASCLALAYQVSPWHRAAAALVDHPQRQGEKRMFHSLNSNVNDVGTLATTEINKGDTVLSVQNTDAFKVGDDIVLIDTSDGSTKNEEARVAAVGNGKLTLEQPVSQHLPSFSFVVSPAEPELYEDSAGGYVFGDTASKSPAPAPASDTASLGPAPGPAPVPPAALAPGPAPPAPSVAPDGDKASNGGQANGNGVPVGDKASNGANGGQGKNFYGANGGQGNGYDANVDFDCDAGYANWALGWSQPKKAYCCDKFEMGCQFDCDAGYANWIAGWSDSKKKYCCETESKGCEGEALIYREVGDGPPAWVKALIILFGILMCLLCLVCLFFCCSRPEVKSAVENTGEQCRKCWNDCTKSCGARAPPMKSSRTKHLSGQEWMFKPTDGRAIVTLTEPEFEAATTGETVEPGEIFVVRSQQAPPMVEHIVTSPVDGAAEIIEAPGGEGKCTFLELADGRGWVLDREPGHEMCYKLFEPVNELWIYDPENGKDMAIRESPYIDGPHTNHRIRPGEKFNVKEIQGNLESGSVLFLKLADGRGWAYDQKTNDIAVGSDAQRGYAYDGEVMCRRILDETWEYRPANSQDIAIREEPDIYGNKTGSTVKPGEQFEVEEIWTERHAHPNRDELPDDFGSGVLFLKLADGRGWLFDKHPDIGTMCIRIS